MTFWVFVPEDRLPGVDATVERRDDGFALRYSMTTTDGLIEEPEQVFGTSAEAHRHFCELAAQHGRPGRFLRPA
jgi:hypothetical protein